MGNDPKGEGKKWMQLRKRLRWRQSGRSLVGADSKLSHRAD